MHPNARILDSRNTWKGVEVRSRILEYLEKSGEGQPVSEIAEGLTIPTYQAYFHLRRLYDRRLVTRKEKRPMKWRSSPLGQKRITPYIP
ncbi:MAG: winged helix-turn-helix domain-containing protein [Candidatus Geothermarchaeales archaeon]